MEFEYKNKWHGISRVNINAGDKWEYLGITNKYLNSVFYKIDDNKRDENGYREVSKREFSILETLFINAAKKTGSFRFFDEDFQEMEKQIDEGKIEGLPKRNPNETIENNTPSFKENVTHHYDFTKQDLEDIKTGKTDIETIRQKYIDKIKEDLKKYNDYDKRFPDGRFEVEVVFNGQYFDSFVYDTEFESFKKSDPQKLNLALNEFEKGNFDAINTIENPVEFLEAFRKKSGGKTMFSELITQYNNRKISLDKLKEYLYTLEGKFTEYEQEYTKANSDNKFDNVHSFWFGSYYNFSSRVIHHVEKEEHMKYKYEHNEVDREQVRELQKFIKDNYNVELNEYIAARIIEQGTFTDYGIYEYDFEELKNHYMNMDERQVEIYTRKTDWQYKRDDVDRNEIKEMQKLFKDEYNKDLSEYDAAYMIRSYRRQFKKGFNLEKLKQDLLNGKIFEENNVKDFDDYLDKRIIWQGVVENDNIETLEAAAQATEQEFGRYNFDIKKSKIADLAYKSEKMRNKSQKELKVTRTDDKISIYNKATKEKRTIDLNQLTSKLDEENKQIILNALSGFNNISLWEFAIEITKSVGTDVTEGFNSIAEYKPENDSININLKSKEKVNAERLLHEMIHAMMSTIIDGKNTEREPLFKEFVDTYNEEQKAHREKRLRNGIADGSNYTYCAQNIHEFAAEAGCLWLSGESRSEYTIATHFPKSYRLFVQLIEKIQAQKTGRSINENITH